MHPSAPEWDFAIFQKNGVNMKPVGVNRCYTVSQWTRIPSILPVGTPPCKGERLASTYRHHHFTLYQLSWDGRRRSRTALLGHQVSRDTTCPGTFFSAPERPPLTPDVWKYRGDI